ncbi:MAG: hypothetical protein IKQ46_04980 [Bacteroidales bacterium]|jgi:hypothetical protein|nr:hypothetical protein [Bacteroidales bacterium]
MLPKFLLADNRIESPDLFYVVHTQEPKFIVEFDSEDFNKKQKLHWLDPKPDSDSEIENLLSQAEEVYNREFDDLVDDFEDAD